MLSSGSLLIVSLVIIVVVNVPPFRKLCPDCGIHLHTKKLKCPCGHSVHTIMECGQSFAPFFALQYVYMPHIDQSMAACRGTWNRHSICSADNWSPIQLWVSGTLQNYYSHH